MKNVPPFVIIDPYQYKGDLAFGLWSEEDGLYVLGDGDCYSAEELVRQWPGSKLLTWEELESRLKRPPP